LSHAQVNGPDRHEDGDLNTSLPPGCAVPRPSVVAVSL